MIETKLTWKKASEETPDTAREVFVAFNSFLDGTYFGVAYYDENQQRWCLENGDKCVYEIFYWADFPNVDISLNEESTIPVQNSEPVDDTVSLVEKISNLQTDISISNSNENSSLNSFLTSCESIGYAVLDESNNCNSSKYPVKPAQNVEVCEWRCMICDATVPKYENICDDCKRAIKQVKAFLTVREVVCEECGAKMKKDTNMILTSMPPKVKYHCKNCGHTKYVVEG